MIYLQLKLPSGKLIKAIGKAIWFERLYSSDSGYVIGINFIKICSDHEMAVKDYVEKASQAKRPIEFKEEDESQQARIVKFSN
jgi:hypothetical protein